MVSPWKPYNGNRTMAHMSSLRANPTKIPSHDILISFVMVIFSKCCDKAANNTNDDTHTYSHKP